jgi:hypothetical protein
MAIENPLDLSIKVRVTETRESGRIRQKEAISDDPVLCKAPFSSIWLDVLCQVTVSIPLFEQFCQAMSSDQLLQLAPSRFDWARFYSIVAIHYEQIDLQIGKSECPLRLDALPEIRRFWSLMPDIGDQLNDDIMEHCMSQSLRH